MEINKKSLSGMATELFCQLADIENLLNVASLAAQAEEAKSLATAKIYWPGMISLIRQEVVTVLSSAENLESQINRQIGG